MQITKASMKVTKDTTGKYAAFEFTCIAGEMVNRKYYENLNLVNKNSTAVEIASKCLSSLCRATGVMQMTQVTQLLGIPIALNLGERQGENTIADIKRANEITPDQLAKKPVGQVAVQQQGVIGQPQQQAQPAWMQQTQPTIAPTQAAFPQPQVPQGGVPMQPAPQQFAPPQQAPPQFTQQAPAQQFQAPAPDPAAMIPQTQPAQQGAAQALPQPTQAPPEAIAPAEVPAWLQDAAVLSPPVEGQDLTQVNTAG